VVGAAVRSLWSRQPAVTRFSIAEANDRKGAHGLDPIVPSIRRNA
jgi:hypothetical protein